MDKIFETEVIERLARIETKLDDYEDIRHKADDAYNKSNQNERRIQELEDNNKWLKRTTIGAVITSLVALIFLFIKLGLGVN